MVSTSVVWGRKTVNHSNKEQLICNMVVALIGLGRCRRNESFNQPFIYQGEILGI